MKGKIVLQRLQTRLSVYVASSIVAAASYFNLHDEAQQFSDEIMVASTFAVTFVLSKAVGFMVDKLGDDIVEDDDKADVE